MMLTSFARTVPFAAAVLVATACGSAEGRDSFTTSDASGSAAGHGSAAQVSGRRLEDAGVSIELPRGWRGRVLAPGVLQAGNFEFVPVDQELPAGEEDPIKAMTVEHALVMILPCGLVSFEGSPRPAPSHLSLHDLSFLALDIPEFRSVMRLRTARSTSLAAAYASKPTSAVRLLRKD